MHDSALIQVAYFSIVVRFVWELVANPMRLLHLLVFTHKFQFKKYYYMMIVWKSLWI